MRRVVLFAACLLQLTLFSTAATSALQAAEWKAGLAKVNITPSTPMPMAGYASRGDKHSEGKLTDLWAKVLVLQDAQGHQAAIVTLDLIGIDRGTSQAIRNDVFKALNWKPGQINLCTSHTHSGPVVAQTLAPIHRILFDEKNQKLVDDYAEFLRKAVVDSVKQAVKDLKPAELNWGSGHTDFAVNRRNNKEPDVPQLRADGQLKGPVDHDVPVLAVRQDGKLTAVLFGYACHSTTLSDMTWNADYGGYAQTDLEKAFPGCQAMFWAGCGADQNPLPRRTVELALQYGNKLATAVTQVLNGTMKPVSGSLKTSEQEVALPLGTLPSRQQIEADTKDGNKYVVARAKYLLEILDSGKQLSQTYPYPVTVWQLGNEIAFVFLGGEVVVDYAIRLKDELGKDAPTKVWCSGYANDVMAYIPSKRVLLEGGYEGGGAMVYYGLPSPWAPEAEDIIVKSAIDQIAKFNVK